MTTQPKIAADGVVFDHTGRLLLIRRKNPPFQGQYALPGGFVEYGETVEQACARELLEETGLQITSQQLIGVYSAPGRDPRGHVISIAFLVRVLYHNPVAGDDATSAEYVENWEEQNLAFDHNDIVRDAIKRFRTLLKNIC